MSKKNRRPQRQKNMGNREYYDAMMGLRRSNATVPVPSGKTYKRPKAGARGREW